MTSPDSSHLLLHQLFNCDLMARLTNYVDRRQKLSLDLAGEEQEEQEASKRQSPTLPSRARAPTPPPRRRCRPLDATPATPPSTPLGTPGSISKEARRQEQEVL